MSLQLFAEDQVVATVETSQERPSLGYAETWPEAAGAYPISLTCR